MTLTVLSKPGCMGCAILKKYLDNKGIKYKPIDVIENPEAIEKYSISTLPVTVLTQEDTEIERVLQFNPPMIDKLIDRFKQQ